MACMSTYCASACNVDQFQLFVLRFFVCFANIVYLLLRGRFLPINEVIGNQERRVKKKNQVKQVRYKKMIRFFIKEKKKTFQNLKLFQSYTKNSSISHIPYNLQVFCKYFRGVIMHRIWSNFMFFIYKFFYCLQLVLGSGKMQLIYCKYTFLMTQLVKLVIVLPRALKLESRLVFIFTIDICLQLIVSRVIYYTGTNFLP